MTQGFNGPDVPETPPAHYTGGLAHPVEVTLTQEAKTRAAKKANRIGVMFMGLALFAVALTHSLPLFFFLFVVMVAANFAAWRYYLKVEREDAAGLAVHARSVDGE